MRFDGFIVWNYWLVLLSFLISWLTGQVVPSNCISNVLDCRHLQYELFVRAQLIAVPSRINASGQIYFAIIVIAFRFLLTILGVIRSLFFTLDRNVGCDILYFHPSAP